jgi:hypothetical protein
MSPLRSVGVRLALAMLVVVAGALAIVYLIVVPRYERSLVNARMSGLERAIREVSTQRTPTFLTEQWVEDVALPIAEGAGATRVVVLSYNASPPTVEPTADSNGGDAL